MNSIRIRKKIALEKRGPYPQPRRDAGDLDDWLRRAGRRGPGLGAQWHGRATAAIGFGDNCTTASGRHS